MKINKSKQELARIISENGGWRDGCDFVVQDKDSFVCFYEGKPTRCGDSWKDKGDCQYRYGFNQDGTIQNWHQTILSREEYFHLYPAPDADGWIEWKGGECPVGGDVCVKFRDGTIQDAGMSAYGFYWKHGGNISDIVAYRPHNPEQAKPEFCESVMRSIPEPDGQVWTNPPTIEQLAADYRSAKDYADRKQQGADAAKADADAKLADLVAAGKALGFELSVTDAGPELVINDWRDLRVGDVIELTGSLNHCWKEHAGIEMTVNEVYHDQGDYDDQVDLLGESGAWSLGGNTTWRFIRRP